MSTQTAAHNAPDKSFRSVLVDVRLPLIGSLTVVVARICRVCEGRAGGWALLGSEGLRGAHWSSDAKLNRYGDQVNGDPVDEDHR